MLPHELMMMLTGKYGRCVIDPHLEQLRALWSEESIAEIENEHRQLCTAYRLELAFKSAIDAYACVEIKSFKAAWKVVAGRFETLHDFCGEIATLFPNTAFIESDFSLLRWELDDHRLSMIDLSLEGVLHCKQYKAIKKLGVMRG